MSDAAPTQSDAQPIRSGRLLDLVQKLIAYGKELAASFQQRNPATELTPILRSFGTADIARILARIRCGLHRAQALEERIIRSAAYLDADPRPQATQAAPHARRPRTARPASRRTNHTGPNITALPTPEQIAAKVRCQPIGAVIADICRDLGILPNHPLWRELQQVINAYRGNYARLVIDILKRPFLPSTSDPADARAVLPAPACATGPP